MTKAINRKRRRAFRQAMAANRIEGLPRTPSGQFSRSGKAKAVRDDYDRTLTKREMEANVSIVRDARIRMRGAKPEKPNEDWDNPCDPRWESALGKMYLRGDINTKQHEAGEFYRRVVERFRRAVQAPKPPASNLGKLLVRDAAERAAGAPAGVRVSMGEDEYVEWYKRSLEQYQEVRRALDEFDHSFGGRGTYRALNAVVLNEQDSKAWAGDLRAICNFIHMRFIA